jgi:hypothetical protein
MLTSIICNWCLVIGVDINVSIAINAKGGYWIMLSLIMLSLMPIGLITWEIVGSYVIDVNGLV